MINASPPAETSVQNGISPRKSKLREIKAVYVYGGKIAPRALLETNMIYKIVFRSTLIPEVGKYLRATATVALRDAGPSLRNENPGARSTRWKPGETSRAREEHIIS